MKHMTDNDWDRLRNAQNRDKNCNQDIMTIVAFMETREEVLTHITYYENR